MEELKKTFDKKCQIKFMGESEWLLKMRSNCKGFHKCHDLLGLQTLLATGAGMVD